METIGRVMTWAGYSQITWIFGLLYYLCGVVMVTSICPSSWSGLAESCLEDHIPPHLADDEVIVTYEYWVVTCRHYNDALSCVGSHIEECQQSGGDVSGSQSILDRLQMDHTNMCGNNQTFERFQTHSKCFEQVGNHTLACQEEYTKTTIYEYIYDEDYEYVYTDEEYDDGSKDLERICSAMKTLLSCINRAVFSICGDDAVDLYNRMVLSQIPSHITETCIEISSTASGLQNISKITILYMFTLTMIVRNSIQFGIT